jgi:hypothetical protein
MAKLVEHSHLVPVSDIHHFMAENVSRQQGRDLFKDNADRDRLIRGLIQGWESSLGIIGARKASEQDQATAVGEREAYIASLEAMAQSGGADEVVQTETGKVTVSPADLLAVVRRMWTKDGKVVKPRYIGAWAFRRANVLPLVNAIAFKQKVDPILDVPVEVREFANDLERIGACIRENTGKLEGNRGLSNADLVGAAKAAFQLGATEAQLGRYFGTKRGMSQKMHRLCQLDSKYPEAKFVEKAMADEGFFKALDKEKMKDLLDAKGDLTSIETQVKQYAENPGAAKVGNDEKIMAKPTIKAISEQNSIEIVKLCFRAVMNNSMTEIEKLLPHAKAINTALEQYLK